MQIVGFDVLGMAFSKLPTYAHRESSLARSAIPESLPHVSQFQLSALFASWRLVAVAKQRYSTNPESGLSNSLRHPNSFKPTAKVHQHTPQITPRQLYAEVRSFILDCAQRASYQQLFCHPQFCFFHTVFWVVSSRFWVVSSWCHLGFGRFHPGFLCHLGLGFFPTDHDTQTTVIFPTQTTFICHPFDFAADSRPRHL